MPFSGTNEKFISENYLSENNQRTGRFCKQETRNHLGNQQTRVWGGPNKDFLKKHNLDETQILFFSLWKIIFYI